MAFVLLGIVAGPLLGGVITEDDSWRWCMLMLPMSSIEFGQEVLTVSQVSISISQ